MASSLFVLERPIVMLSDYVAAQPTTLQFKNHGKCGSTITDITQGLDMSVASAIVGYLAALLYDSPQFMSDTKAEGSSSNGVGLTSAMTMGAAIGGDAGGGAGAG